MDILVENSAFQNFGVCLHKKCTDSDQAEDFLQLCIQMVFYNKISLSGLVPEYVSKKSAEIIELLKKEYHIKNINFQNMNEKNSDSIVRRVSSEYHSKMNTRLHEYESVSTAGTFLPKLSHDILERIKVFTEAIKTGSYDVVTGELFKQSSFTTDSALAKIITFERKIFDELVKFSEEHGWDEMKGFQLISDLRIITNKILSIENNKIYSPGVKRGRKEKQIIKLFSEKIEEILKKANDEGWGPQFDVLPSIELPSIKNYLINKGGCKPNEILKITSDLREKFAPVRSYIQMMGKNNIIDSVKAINEICMKLSDEMKMGKQSKTKIIFENIPTFGVGPFSLPVPNIPDINRGFKLYICVQAFTEIMDDMLKATSIFSEEEFIKNCMG